MFIAAAVASLFGDRLRLTLTLGGDGGGVFDLDSRSGVTLTVTRVAAPGPPAAQATDALAGRAEASVGLGDAPAGARAALLRMAGFFNTPVEQGPA